MNFDLRYGCSVSAQRVFVPCRGYMNFDQSTWRIIASVVIVFVPCRGYMNFDAVDFANFLADVGFRPLSGIYEF